MKRFAYLPLLLILLGASVLWLAESPRHCTTHAYSGDSISDYCYHIPLAITNSTGSPLTNYAVRVGINSGQLIATSFITPYLLDLRPVNTGLNPVEVTAQQPSANPAYWWIYVSSLGSGASANYNLYMGNATAQRNQGFLLTGSDLITVLYHSDFEIADNLEVKATASAYTEPLDAWFVSKWTTDTGYRLGMADSSGSKIRAQVDDQVLDVDAPSTSTTGCTVALTVDDCTISMTFVNPTLTIYFNGVAQDTLDTGLATITPNSTDITMGDALVGVLRDVEINYDYGAVGYAVAGRWGFSPDVIAETSASSPSYAGTISDDGPNSHDATYALTRSQTNIGVVVGAVAFGSASSPLSVPDYIADVIGPINTSNYFTQGTPVAGMPLYAELEAARSAVGMPNDAFYLMIFGAPSVLLGGLFFFFSRNYWITTTMPGIGLLAGNVFHVLMPMYTILYIMAIIGIWLIHKAAE